MLLCMTIIFVFIIGPPRIWDCVDKHILIYKCNKYNIYIFPMIFVLIIHKNEKLSKEIIFHRTPNDFLLSNSV